MNTDLIVNTVLLFLILIVGLGYFYILPDDITLMKAQTDWYKTCNNPYPFPSNNSLIRSGINWTS